MKIVSFNLRCLFFGDGINSFVFRAGLVYDKIKKEYPDIIAFQEVTPGHIELLRKLLDNYEFFGQMRTENYDGEGVYTAIKKDTFEILSADSFWLSDTPYVPASRFENQSECPRVCAMTFLRNKQTGEKMRIFNVHLDYESDAVQTLGMKCVFEQIAACEKSNPAPTVILGDFNAMPDSETYRYCLNDAPANFFDATRDIPGTFHDFGRLKCPQKIDYILVTKEIYEKVKSCGIYDDKCDGIYLSDHYPVYIEL